MLAAHADQENLVASHQQAAQAKPLNAGTRAFGAKTPANNKAPKTPFRVPLNDENGATRAGKTGVKTAGKGAENQLQPAGKKGGQADSSAFVTPAGPRMRAPLGMKTTNAKATAFATPAPQTEPGSEKTGVKSSGPRLRRAKVKVHQASPAVDIAHDGEREIEFMPPREIPLADDPDDWPSDMKYPQFEGKNLVRGIYQTYYDPVGDDGVHLSDKRNAEHKAKVNARHEAMLQRNLEETLGPLTEEEREVFGFAPASKPAPKPQSGAASSATVASTSRPTTTTRRPLSATLKPTTLSSRNAVSALSSTGDPTASMRAHGRSRSALSSIAPATTAQPRRRPTVTTPQPANPSDMRFQAATAASRTTLGYGKGRTVGTSVRKPLGVSSGNQQRSASQSASIPSRSASTASTRPAVPARSRSAWGRHESDMTLVASQPGTQPSDENDDPEMEMIREMAMRNLCLDDDLDGDDWFSQAQADNGTLGAGIGDDDEEFQFTIPQI
ncbi:hypothetical protein SLS56_010309 [Neofusicoccum ribis]|uniref:Uncharacterized protein n=1 Tax=Neofusicoccum ribis TaxID=45134 RepID=A0ABR3SET9_9PEZI